MKFLGWKDFPPPPTCKAVLGVNLYITWSEWLLLTIAVAVKRVLHSARNLCAIKQVHYPQHAVLEKWLHSRLELMIQYLLNFVLCTGDWCWCVDSHQQYHCYYRQQDVSRKRYNGQGGRLKREEIFSRLCTQKYLYSLQYIMYLACTDWSLEMPLQSQMRIRHAITMTAVCWKAQLMASQQPENPQFAPKSFSRGHFSSEFAAKENE